MQGAGESEDLGYIKAWMNTHGEKLEEILAANEGLRNVFVECGFNEDMADN